MAHDQLIVPNFAETGLYGVWWGHSSAKIRQDPPAVDRVIVLAHGIHQHAALYENFAKHLIGTLCRGDQYNDALTYAVFAYDIRGFGHSVGRGDLDANARGMITDFDDAVEDLRNACKYAKDASGAEKLLLFGHSLGGLLAVMLGVSLLSSDNDSNDAGASQDAKSGTTRLKVDGFILSGPSVAIVPSLRYIPAETILGCLPATLTLDTYKKDTATDNAAFLQAWDSGESEGLVLPERPFYARYVQAAVRAQKAVRQHFGRVGTVAPMLVLHGTHDTHDCGAAEDLYAACGGTQIPAAGDGTAPPFLRSQVLLNKYEGFKHEDIVFKDFPSMDRNPAVADMVKWLADLA